MEKFSPTLIIGLGGIGSQIVESVYRKFEAGHPSDLERANAAFLCLDTDEDDIEDRRAVMPSTSVVKTSSDLSSTIGQYIDRIKHKTTVEKWFDTSSRELNSMPLNSGAAQVRMASRLAMMSAINEGRFAAIDNAITQLMSTNPARHNGNDIKIHLISSLAGGTGAGTFLQVAYYVKNAMIEHGAGAPRINGYFMLADVLCDDPNCGFSKDQKENTRSNTYACMKELSAFSSKDRNNGLKKIEFEYRLGQRDKSLPNDPPYNVCFIMDHNGANGGNLIKHENYYEQMVSYVFLSAFSDVGDNYRQRAINDIRQMIESDGMKKYAAIGLSKLVYPVDDLFTFFAHQRVADNLSTTWCQNDRDIQARFDEYKRNVFYGIPDTQPDKGLEFIGNVERYKEGAGSIAAQFRQIYNSTQILNEEMMPIGTKAMAYIKSVEAFVVKMVNKSKEMEGWYEECTKPIFTFKDESQDVRDVVKREKDLDMYKRSVMAFIDGSKQFVIRECLFVDHDAEDYVSLTPDMHRHHLNTYILEKGNEMHPIAARYFLYDIKRKLKSKLDGKEGLRKSNEAKRKQIEEEYKDSFDIQETKQRKETAQDRITIASKQNSGINKVTGLFSGQNPYKAAKDDYLSKSRQQAETIHEYATEKLLEEVYSGLLDQINRLIDESELFFENLPAAIQSIDDERIALMKKHSVENSDPSVEYVLASEDIKKSIYDYIISRNDSPFFPSKMSASIYCTMFNNVYDQLNTGAFATLGQKDKKARKAEAIKANQKIIRSCIAYQDELIRESDHIYAEMNVIDALKEEARIVCDHDEQKAKEYMAEKFRHFRDRAEIFGPNDLDDEVRYINAWALHPDCLDIVSISKAEADELFGDTAVDTNPKNAATRLVSEYFDRHELIRANTVTLLSVDKHFKKFVAKASTQHADESIGCYYTAYQDVIDKMSKQDSDTFSPHLDKCWHLPSYMPNIGSSMSYEKKKLFRALYGGLLLEKFKAVYDGGEYYWKYRGKTSRYIKDMDGHRVTIGQGQVDALNNLFLKGLVNNPDIVDQVNELVDEQWKEAKEKWLGADCIEANELQKMKESSMVKAITEFRFNIHSSFRPQNQNWFTVLNSRKGLALARIIEEHRDFFFEDLLGRLIELFGPSVNTMKVCKFVLGKVGANLKDDADSLLERFVDDGRFEPKDE